MGHENICAMAVALGLCLVGCAGADVDEDLLTAGVISGDSGEVDDNGDDSGTDSDSDSGSEPDGTSGPEPEPEDDSTGEPEVDAECQFEARTIYTDPSGQPVESIIAYGRRFDFIGDDYTPGTNSGADLSFWPHYASGPCAAQPALDCHFDSRVVVQIDGQWVESITADGRYWNFDLDLTTGAVTAWPSNGGTLDSVDRFAAGPCQGQPAGQCRFDSREILVDGAAQIESITADGRFWNFDVDPATGASTPWPSNGNALDSVDRYATGPCDGESDCTFDTRTLIEVDGVLIESIVAHGRFFNWDTETDEAWPSNGSVLESVSRYTEGPCSFATP